jgi:hypothetical protein
MFAFNSKMFAFDSGVAIALAAADVFAFDSKIFADSKNVVYALIIIHLLKLFLINNLDDLYNIDLTVPEATIFVLNKYNINSREELVKIDDRKTFIEDIKIKSKTHWDKLKYPESAVRKQYCKILFGYKNFERHYNNDN